MASMTGSAPPIAVSGAAAATTRNTIPITPIDPRRPPPAVPSGDCGAAVGAGWVGVHSLMAGTALGPARAGPGAAVGTGVRGDVERGVAVEEAHGLEPETGVVDRHDRPVLGPRDVREAEGVPHDDVGALELPVCGGVPR